MCACSDVMFFSYSDGQWKPYQWWEELPSRLWTTAATGQWTIVCMCVCVAVCVYTTVYVCTHAHMVFVVSSSF